MVICVIYTRLFVMKRCNWNLHISAQGKGRWQPWTFKPIKWIDWDFAFILTLILANDCHDWYTVVIDVRITEDNITVVSETHFGVSLIHWPTLALTRLYSPLGISCNTLKKINFIGKLRQGWECLALVRLTIYHILTPSTKSI